MTIKTLTTVVEIAESKDHKPGAWAVEATFGIVTSGARPCFFLTGQAWRLTPGNRRRRQEPDVCGQIRELILTAFPHLELLAQAHLHDAVTGEPHSALENAWYWFVSPGHALIDDAVYVPPRWRHLDGAGRAAAYLGCDPGLFGQITPSGPDDALMKAEFARRVDLLRPAWSHLAEVVRGLYGLDLPNDASPDSAAGATTGCGVTTTGARS